MQCWYVHIWEKLSNNPVFFSLENLEGWFMNASLVCWDNIPYGGNGIKVDKHSLWWQWDKSGQTFPMVAMG